MKSKKLRFIILSAALLLALVFSIFHLIPIDTYKSVIEQRISEAIDQEVIIEGDVEIGLSIRPEIVLHDVIIKDHRAKWLPKHTKLKRVEVGLKLLPLILGKVDLAHIKVDGGDLVLAETKKRTTLQVLFPRLKHAVYELNDIQFENVDLSVYSSRKLTTQLTINKMRLYTSYLFRGAKVLFNGVYNKHTINLSGKISMMQQNAKNDSDSDFNFSITYDLDHFKINGNYNPEQIGKWLTIDYQAQGKRLRELLKLPSRQGGHYKLHGHIGAENRIFTISFKGMLLNGDIEGRVVMNAQRNTPRWKITMDGKNMHAAQFLQLFNLGHRLEGGSIDVSVDIKTVGKYQNTRISKASGDLLLHMTNTNYIKNV